MFGSFADERKEEPVVYGLISPIKTYNPITIQCKYFVDLFHYWTTSTTLSKKMQKTIRGPGWNVDKQEFYPLPPIEPNPTPWHKPNDTFMNLYLLSQVNTINNT